MRYQRVQRQVGQLETSEGLPRARSEEPRAAVGVFTFEGACRGPGGRFDSPGRPPLASFFGSARHTGTRRRIT